MTDITCECGHHINGHGDNGCIHYKCSESRKILELSNENDALRKQNEMEILSELMRVEFYGANGYCTVCHQPLEGRGCPYCGWEDKNPPQYGYEFVHRTKQSHLLCPICGKNVKRVNVIPDCQHTTREIFEYAYSLQAKLNVAMNRYKWIQEADPYLLGNDIEALLFGVERDLEEIEKLEKRLEQTIV